MATGTNGIATMGDCNKIMNYSFDSNYDSTCPTKKQINACSGLNVSGGSYSDNQLVKYENISSVTSKTFTISIQNTMDIVTEPDYLIIYSKTSGGTLTERLNFDPGKISKNSTNTYIETITTPSGVSASTFSYKFGNFSTSRTIRYSFDGKNWSTGINDHVIIEHSSTNYQLWWNTNNTIYFKISGG